MKKVTKITDREVANRLDDLRFRLGNISDQYKDKTGLSLKKQCAQMGIKDTNLSKYKKPFSENEPVKMQVDKLIRICEYYNISADYLLGLTTEEKSPQSSGSEDEIIKQIRDYTGLSREAVSALHKHQSDFLHAMALSFLLSTNGVIDTIVDYLLTSLYDDLAKDQRYNHLPCAKKSSNTEGRPLYAEVLEMLQSKRMEFHSKMCASSSTLRKCVTEMIFRSISPEEMEEIFSILYPYLHYGLDSMLPPDEATAQNAQLQQQEEERIASDTSSAAINRRKLDIWAEDMSSHWKEMSGEDYEETCRAQCDSFYREFFRRFGHCTA